MSIASWVNPLPTEGIAGTSHKLTPRQSWQEKKKMDDMVRAAAQTGLGWFGVMFATRLAMGAINSGDDKALKKKLKSYSEARTPLVSFREKESADDEQGSVFNPVRKLINSFTRTDKSALQIAAALAAAGTGATLGWQLADRLADKHKDKVRHKNIYKNEAQLDRLLTEEYMRTRNLGKFAAEHKDPETSWIHGLKAVYPVYALGMIFLAYKLAKDTMDATDPERMKLKSLKEYARQRALIENPPVLMDSLKLPDFDGGLKAGKSSVSGRVELPSNRRSSLLEV